MATAFKLVFQGSQEVPPKVVKASGTGLVIFDDVTNSASYQYTVSGIDFGGQTTGAGDDITNWTTN